MVVVLVNIMKLAVAVATTVAVLPMQQALVVVQAILVVLPAELQHLEYKQVTVK
ncbi:MAG: hypothetical protein IPH46_00605 [Bacteroidetes bacterium]|nr:hypothetical protein [Bacteroidota bacterium]